MRDQFRELPGPELNRHTSLIGTEREKATSQRRVEQVSKMKIQSKPKDYLPPQRRSASVSERTRESKRKFAKIRHTLVCEIDRIFPGLCNESLDAKAFKEFLKLEGHHHASLEPLKKRSLWNPHGNSHSVSWIHPGIFDEANYAVPCWSCCLKSSETSTGCQSVFRHKRTWSFLP